MSEPAPIRKSALLDGRQAKYEESSVLGGAHGVLLWPGVIAGRVVVRRRVEYGDWEPVSPPFWAPEKDSEITGETAEVRLVGIRRMARILTDSADSYVWRVAHAMERLCMGTITVAQAHAELED